MYHTLRDYARVLQCTGKFYQDPVAPQTPVDYTLEEQSKEDYFGELFYHEEAEAQMTKFILSLRVARCCSDLPKKPGVYFLFNIQDDLRNLLYIGSSTNLRNRWGSHAFRSVLGRPDFFLYWKPVNFGRFVNHLNEEAYYVSFLQPPLNVVVSRVKLRRYPGDRENGLPYELIDACSKMLLSQFKE